MKISHVKKIKIVRIQQAVVHLADASLDMFVIWAINLYKILAVLPINANLIVVIKKFVQKLVNVLLHAKKIAIVKLAAVLEGNVIS